MDALLEVRDLKIAFDSPRGVIRAVRGVSFSLCAGETLAVVGESGCGKSVLCKSLLGLLPHRGRVAGGSILYAGRDLAAMGERELEGIRGKEIALVLQNPMSALNPSLPVGSQIARRRPRARRDLPRRGEGARARADGPDRHPRTRAAVRRLSAPVFRRDAPALRARVGACLRPEAACRRRADHRARRDRAGADARSAAGHPAPDGYGDPLYHPRPRRGGPDRRARRRHVRGAGSSRSAPRRKSTTTRAIPTPGGCSRPFPPRGDGGALRIPGAPSRPLHPPAGDAFAPRNPWALGVDWREEPPSSAFPIPTMPRPGCCIPTRRASTRPPGLGKGG